MAKETLKKYGWIILLVTTALVGACLFVLQHFLIWQKVVKGGGIYNFFTFAHPDPYTYWAAMFRDILDGHFWITDGRVFESANLPSLWSVLAPIIASPIIFLFKNMSYVFPAGLFLAALLAFFIYFLLTKKIVGSKFFALFFTFVFTVAMLIWDFLFPISLENLKIIARGVFYLGSPTTDILMSRYVSLSIFPTLPFFALAFYSIFQAITGKRFVWTMLAGIFTSLLIYLVITDAIYIFVGLSFMLVLFLVSKDWGSAKIILRIFGIAALVSIFYWFNFVSIRSLPWSDEFYRRLGGDFSHSLRLSLWNKYLGYLIMAGLIWFWGKRNKRQDVAIYVISFVLAGIGVLNIQILTGFNPQPTAWFTHQFYFGLSLGWLILIFWFFRYIKSKGRKYQHIFVTAAFLLILSLTARTIYTYFYIANDQARYHYLPANISMSMNWLNVNTPRDSVIATPSLVANVVIPVESHNRVFLPAAVSSPASQAEILDRLFILYKLFNVSDDYLRSALVKTDKKIDNFALNQESNLMIFTHDTYFFDTSLDSFFRGRSSNKLPAEAVEDIVANYNKYPERPAYLLSSYKIDYLYYGPYEKRISQIDFSKMNFLEKMYDQGGVEIYKIKKL